MNIWGEPSWREQGRTGPGPVAPRYASRRDRNTVRSGGTPGGDGKTPKKCCAMVEAGRAARRGKFRLARRYAVMSIRLALS